jgi:hypothetical protein
MCSGDGRCHNPQKSTASDSCIRQGHPPKLTFLTRHLVKHLVMHTSRHGCRAVVAGSFFCQLHIRTRPGESEPLMCRPLPLERTCFSSFNNPGADEASRCRGGSRGAIIPPRSGSLGVTTLDGRRTSSAIPLREASHRGVLHPLLCLLRRLNTQRRRAASTSTGARRWDFADRIRWVTLEVPRS